VREKGRPNTPAFSTRMSNFLHIKHQVSVFNNISYLIHFTQKNTKFITPWKRVLLERLIFTYLAKKFPACYGM
jgi:hypothetical protein